MKKLVQDLKDNQRQYFVALPSFVNVATSATVVVVQGETMQQQLDCLEAVYDKYKAYTFYWDSDLTNQVSLEEFNMHIEHWKDVAKLLAEVAEAFDWDQQGRRKWKQTSLASLERAVGLKGCCTGKSLNRCTCPPNHIRQLPGHGKCDLRAASILAGQDYIPQKQENGKDLSLLSSPLRVLTPLYRTVCSAETALSS
eukprot:g11655.t1